MVEEDMDGKAKSRNSGITGTPPARRPYRAPRVVALGSLRALTQGQGSANTDGASGMGLPALTPRKTM
jgi:hypothetical protein